MAELELLTFPTDYPIKVVGHHEATLRARVDAIMLQHAPDLDLGCSHERASGQGNFLAISYVFVARSQEQVVALATELAATDGVVMVI